MSRIEPLARYVPPAPHPGDRSSGHDRRIAARDRRRAGDPGGRDSIVIDLDPDDGEFRTTTIAANPPRRAAAPVAALGLADASREVLAYEVISRLGSETGFGEKGRLVSVYL
jgi:hypothetical protein